MKKNLLVIALSIVTTLSLQAQEKTLPRSEYTVSLSENVVNLKPGETKQLTVSILKSKSYARSKATLGLSSALPQGVSVSYEPAEGMFESSTASFSAAPEAQEGTYQVILKTTVNNKIKGSIVKVVVGSGDPKDAITAN
jgi:hypothetical protein